MIKKISLAELDGHKTKRCECEAGTCSGIGSVTGGKWEEPGYSVNEYEDVKEHVLNIKDQNAK